MHPARVCPIVCAPLALWAGQAAAAPVPPIWSPPPAGSTAPPADAIVDTHGEITPCSDWYVQSADGNAWATGSIVHHEWSFGDGETATGATVQHSYAQAGTYTVTLTVADRYGRSSSAVRPITVEDSGR